jgi:predicted S18 family serine protease
LLGSIEQKYKSQIKDQIENNQKMLNDLNEKNKYLEKENRQLQNRLQLEQRDKMSDHGAMEKKVSELMENESRL